MLLNAVLPRARGRPSFDPQASWQDVIGNLNAGIQKIADEEAVHWVDCGSTVFGELLKRGRTSLMNDDLHPNVEGAEAYAQCLLPRLRELYALPPVE